MYTFYFKAVVKLVLLFSLEIWVVTSRIGRALGGVPGPGGKTSDGRILRRKPDRKWKYTSPETSR